jgi:hypothetical protein
MTIEIVGKSLLRQRNREPPEAGFPPDCPVQMLAPQTRSGAL